MTRAHHTNTSDVPSQPHNLRVIPGAITPVPSQRQRQEPPLQAGLPLSVPRQMRRHSRLAQIAATTDALAGWRRGTVLSAADYALILACLPVDDWKLFSYITATPDALIQANRYPYQAAAKLGFTICEFDRSRAEVHRLVMLHVNFLNGRGPGLPGAKRAHIPTQRTS